MRRSFQVRGGVALVTGAGSGIGRATSIALAHEGATVLCVDIHEVSAKSTAESCRQGGAEAVAYHCDVADRSAVADLAVQVGREHGPLRVLVNNAGVGMSGGLADMAPEDWEWIRSINLDGVVHGCQAFGPSMLEQGTGHIVNMSSGLAFLLRSSEVAYCTTKAAVLVFSRCLRSDWRPRGVSVSAVCPGVINTPILESSRLLGAMSHDRARARAQRAFGHGHRAETVARAVLQAIHADKAVVTAGLEARIGWHLARLMPVALADRLGRPPPGWVTGGG